VLRPFFNYYEFFIRPPESNFYTAVLSLVLRFAGFSGALIVLGGLIFLGLLFLSALLPSRKNLKLSQPPRNAG
jgi:hypothetical protein